MDFPKRAVSKPRTLHFAIPPSVRTSRIPARLSKTPVLIPSGRGNEKKAASGLGYHYRAVGQEPLSPNPF